jgi:hypothetical protein
MENTVLPPVSATHNGLNINITLWIGLRHFFFRQYLFPTTNANANTMPRPGQTGPR